MSWLLPENFPINIDHFDESETFLEERGHEGSKIISGGETGLTTLSKFCKGLQITPFWSWDWTLGVRPNIASRLDLGGQDHIRQEDALGQLKYNPLISDMKSNIVVNYLLNEAAGTLANQRRVTDATRSPRINTTENFEWGRSFV